MMVTTLEQSKKLVEFGIDASTADMSWYQPNIMYPYELHTKYKGHGIMADGSDDLVPAWSLSALLELMPSELGNNYFLTLFKETYISGNEYTCCYEDYNGNSLYSFFGKNAVDAAFEMACWLKEYKYF